MQCNTKSRAKSQIQGHSPVLETVPGLQLGSHLKGDASSIGGRLVHAASLRLSEESRRPLPRQHGTSKHRCQAREEHNTLTLAGGTHICDLALCSTCHIVYQFNRTPLHSISALSTSYWHLQSTRSMWTCHLRCVIWCADEYIERKKHT